MPCGWHYLLLIQPILSILSFFKPFLSSFSMTSTIFYFNPYKIQASTISVPSSLIRITANYLNPPNGFWFWLVFKFGLHYRNSKRRNFLICSVHCFLFCLVVDKQRKGILKSQQSIALDFSPNCMIYRPDDTSHRCNLIFVINPIGTWILSNCV